MKFFKNFTYSAIESSISVVLGFFINILFARYLKPEKLGEFNYIIWLVTFFSTVIMLSLPITLTKYISQYYPDKIDRVKSIVYNLGKISLFLFIIAVMLLFVYFHFNKMYLLFIILVLFLILNMLNSLIDSILKGVEIFSILATATFLSLIFKLIVTLLFLRKIPTPVIGLWINITTLSLGLIIKWVMGRQYIWLFLKDADKSCIELNSIEIDYFKFTSIILIFDFIVWQNSEVFFLKIFSSVKEIAFYTVAFSLAYLPSRTIIRSFSQVLLPFMSSVYGKSAEKLSDVYKENTRFLGILITPIYVFMYIYAKEIITILYGIDYLPAAFVFQLIIIASFIGGIVTVGSTYFHAIEKPSVIFKIGIFTSIFNIVANIYFIPKYNAIGAAIGNSLAQLFGCLMGTGYLIYKYNLKFPFFYILKYLITSISLSLLLKIFVHIKGIISLFTISIFYILFLWFTTYFTEKRDWNKFIKEYF